MGKSAKATRIPTTKVYKNQSPKPAAKPAGVQKKALPPKKPQQTQTKKFIPKPRS